MGSTGEASDSQIRREIAQRMEQDPGLPVDTPTVSFWQQPEHPFAHVQSPSLPQDADVVIIGSGITSISTAQHLLRLEPHLQIVILEARAAISGATVSFSWVSYRVKHLLMMAKGRNGGHIKASPWADYSDLKKLFGKKSGMKIIKFRMTHLDAICSEAAALGEASEPGLVRRTQSLSTSYNPKTWESSKKRLAEFLADFPEEDGKWIAIDDRAELKVCLSHMPFGVGTIGVLSIVRNWGYRRMHVVQSRDLKEQLGLTVLSGPC